jgi:O-antigen ligase
VVTRFGRLVSEGSSKKLGLLQRRGTTAQITLLALIGLVIIGLDPLGQRIKTLPATGEGDLMRQLSYVLIFGFAVITTKGMPQFRQFIAVPLSILSIILLCWISLFWAIEPSIAIRRLILTTMIIWIIFKSVEQGGYEITVSTIRTIFLITLVLNYASILITPAAIHLEEDLIDPGLIGTWRGILPQKNFTGAVCALTILIFTFDAKRIKTVVRFLVIIGTLFFLYKTQSKTSLALLLIALGAGYAFQCYNPAYRVSVIAGVVFTIVTSSILAWIFWDFITAPLANPDALTGRMQIWPVLWQYWQDNWLLGSGYGSFWNIGPYTPIYSYAKGWVALLGNGHNGYLDLLVQLGLPGLILAILALVILPFTYLLTHSRIPRPQGALLTSFLTFCVLHNLMESSMLDRDMIIQVFLMLTIALIYKVDGPLPLASQPPLAAPKTVVLPAVVPPAVVPPNVRR